jgi:acetyl esterase/lipase
VTHAARPSRPTARTRLGALAAALATATLAAGALAQAPLPVAPPAVDAAGLPAGRLVEATYVERWTPQQVQERAGVAFGGYGAPLVENAVDLWLLRFTTTRFDGEVAVVRARAFTPVDPPRGAAPLLVYGSGTTGVADVCAPSREYERATPLGYYRELLAPYAGRGFATVFPDYLGFEDPDRPQAYFHADSEAHVLLDAARAMTELYARTGDLGALRAETFFGGYSQGGHAALAVADQHATYAPDVRVAGVMGFAATTDVEALLATAAYYAPFVLLAYRSIYGDAIDAAQVLAPRFVPTLEQDAGAFCVDRAQQVYPYDGAGTYTADFHRALQAGDPGAVAPEFARALAANATGLSGHGLPALVVQGGQDVIVLDRTQERFVDALCAAGSPVTYLNVPTARHRDTRPAGFTASVEWMWALANGAPAPSTCAD